MYSWNECDVADCFFLLLLFSWLVPVHVKVTTVEKYLPRSQDGFSDNKPANAKKASFYFSIALHRTDGWDDFHFELRFFSPILFAVSNEHFFRCHFLHFTVHSWYHTDIDNNNRKRRLRSAILFSAPHANPEPHTPVAVTTFMCHLAMILRQTARIRLV